MPVSALTAPILAWYQRSARSLPWREPDVGAWPVLVSEVMLQQTPVSRVLPAYERWLGRWPTPSALAAEPPGAAIAEWGRLGYPRRALRLHAAATVIDRDHDGAVPSSYEQLRALPGVGDYTAAAVRAFAHRQRAVVLDTNVRRVLARILHGTPEAPATITRGERDAAEAVLPDDGETAARWSVAVMELGALVCTARRPACESCPVLDACRWRQTGRPPGSAAVRRRPGYAGTDRECRGRILALVRDADRPVRRSAVDGVWALADQRERALASLLDDGLLVVTATGDLALP